MPIKNKTMALIRLRKTPYSGLLSFLQDVFYRDVTGVLADKALKLLKRIYKEDVKASDWRVIISELFNVSYSTSADESVLDEVCFNHLGFHRMDVEASKHKLRGRKVYQGLIEKDKAGVIKLSDRELSVLKKVNGWNKAVTSYYSVLNKLKALGFIEKKDKYYSKSQKFKNRFTQVIDLMSGFENELSA